MFNLDLFPVYLVFLLLFVLLVFDISLILRIIFSANRKKILRGKLTFF